MSRHRHKPGRGGAKSLEPLPAVPEDAPIAALTYACLGDVNRVRRIVEELPDAIRTVMVRAGGEGRALGIEYGQFKPREETEIFGKNPSRARTSAVLIALDLTRIPDDAVLRPLVWRETLRWAQTRLGPLHFRAWRSFLSGADNELPKVGDLLKTLQGALLNGQRIPLPPEGVSGLMLSLQIAFLDVDRERFLYDQKLVRPEEQWPILEDLIQNLASMRAGPRKGEALGESWTKMLANSPNEPGVMLAQIGTFVLHNWINVLSLRWSRLAPILWARERTGIVERFLTVEREIQQRSLGRFWDDELLERTFRSLAAAGGNSGLAWKAWHELARETAAWLKRELGPEVEASRPKPRKPRVRVNIGRPEKARPSPDPRYGYIFGCANDDLPRLEQALAGLRSALSAAGLGEPILTPAALDDDLRKGLFSEGGRVGVIEEQWIAAFDLGHLGDAELRAHLAHAALLLIDRQHGPESYSRDPWTAEQLQEALDELGEPLFEEVARELGIPEGHPLLPEDDQEAANKISPLSLRFVADVLEARREEALLARGLVTAEQAAARVDGLAAAIERAHQKGGLGARDIEAEIGKGATRVEGLFAAATSTFPALGRLALLNFNQLGALSRRGQGAAAVERHAAAVLANLKIALGPYLDETAFASCWRAMIAADDDLPGIVRPLVDLALAHARAIDRATPRKEH